jgi:hypothetical protein
MAKTADDLAGVVRRKNGFVVLAVTVSEAA